MNIKNHKELIRVAHHEPAIIQTISEKLISWLPTEPHEYIAMFIGTDRATGDSLGPLAGTLFQDIKPKHMKTYGSLKEPIHAKNLYEYMNLIAKVHHKPFIIAIDACLGKSSSIGKIIAGRGSIVPGAALKKDLPPVGDIHMTGVVNVGGFMDFAVLQNTRLSLVYDMSQQIANILEYVDNCLTSMQHPPAIVIKQPEKRSS